MTSRFTELVIDCHDPHVLASFWAAVLDYTVIDERDEEVERLIALGARRVDIGQGEQSWVVLADPEGNEFCVLRSLPP